MKVVSSIRNLRKRHAVLKMDPFNKVHLTYFRILLLLLLLLLALLYVHF
jgi:hypothetical protein